VLHYRSIHISGKLFGANMPWWPLSRPETIQALPALSAFIALFAASAGVWFSMRTLRLALLKQKLDLMTTEFKYFEDIRWWGEEVVDALSEAMHLCDLDPNRVEPTIGSKGESFFERRHRLRITMSSMIDRGRWFFPNTRVDDHGSGKEPGYQGYRHEVLDGLVTAYQCLGPLDFRDKKNNQFLRGELIGCKRHFVGRLQTILDPTRRSDVFNELRNKAEKAAIRPAG
jgi:hypothetical protein